MHPFQNFDLRQVPFSCVRTGRELPGLQVLAPSVYRGGGRYLLRCLEDVALEAMEDIDDSSVVVLQRGSHHHVVVGILIEVLNRGDGGAESGILVTVGILQCSIVNKPVLRNQCQEKAQGDLARALWVVTPSGLQHPLCVSPFLSCYISPMTEEVPILPRSTGVDT